MRPEDIQELLDRRPFVAFRIFVTNGDHLDITERHSVAVGRGHIFIVLPDDRWKWIPYWQISSLETLQAA